MRILHLCKMDSGGGAADGFLRIHRALLAQGAVSQAYVMKRRLREPGVVDASSLVPLARKLAWAGGRIAGKARRLGADVEGIFDFDAEASFPLSPVREHARSLSSRWDMVLVHWAGGFVTAQAVADLAADLGAKVGLWQVDMAHMTGGCHYSLACERYRTGCGSCPAIRSSDPGDISSLQAETRADAWRRAGAIVLAQSRWSACKAAESFVLRGLPAEVLPIPMDLSFADPGLAREEAARRLGLPADGRRTFLVRAVDPAVHYKGFAVFLDALRLLDERNIPMRILTVGDRGLVPAGLRNVTHVDLGHVSAPALLGAAYRAAEAFVCPSVDDAGPMMVPEAMVSGAPVIASPVGIAPDIIIPDVNGALLPREGDPVCLADEMERYALMDTDELRARGVAAAAVAPMFGAERFTSRLRAVLRS